MIRICTNFKSLLCLLAILTSMIAGMPAQASARFDKIYVQCAVSQGNGFNWASTLAWLSGVVRQAGFKAYQYELANPGRRAGVDMSCYTGASSSGFVTALFDYLLSNPQMVGEQGKSLNRKILTSQQTFDIADALYFFSLSTDFHGETFDLLSDRLLNRLFNRDQQSHRIPFDYWKADGSSQAVFPVFLKRVYAAYLYNPSWIKGTNLDRVSTSAKLRRLQQKYTLNDLVSFPSMGSRSEIAQSKSIEGRELSHLMKNLMYQARDKVSREMRGKTLQGIKTQADDFCVTTFAIEVQAPFSKRLPYDPFRIIYMCSDKTIQKLTRSAVFKESLRKSDQMKDKIILASAPNWITALNLSGREPGILSELSGIPTQEPLNLSQLFEYKDGGFKKLTPRGPWLIMGGFPDPRQQAWAVSALLEDRLVELKRLGFEVEGRLAIFGKTEDRQNPQSSFSQQTMVQYFTDGSQDQVSKVLNRFYSWQDEYCHALPRYSSPTAVDFYRMDWNISSKPAALFDRSHILTAKGHNLVQIQTDFAKHEKLTPLFAQALSYDPMDTEVFIPSSVGLPCR